MATVGRIADTVPMTYARSQIAPPGEYGCFHVALAIRDRHEIRGDPVSELKIEAQTVRTSQRHRSVRPGRAQGRWWKDWAAVRR